MGTTRHDYKSSMTPGSLNHQLVFHNVHINIAVIENVTCIVYIYIPFPLPGGKQYQLSAPSVLTMELYIHVHIKPGLCFLAPFVGSARQGHLRLHYPASKTFYCCL